MSKYMIEAETKYWVIEADSREQAIEEAWVNFEPKVIVLDAVEVKDE